jgi:hypothetical protein
MRKPKVIMFYKKNLSSTTYLRIQGKSLTTESYSYILYSFYLFSILLASWMIDKPREKRDKFRALTISLAGIYFTIIVWCYEKYNVFSLLCKEN